MDHLLSRLTPEARSTRCDFGLAIDTIAFGATNPGAAPAAGSAVLAPGDANRVRFFSSTSKALLLELWRQGVTAGFVEVRSPAFHDNVRGLHFLTTETPARFAMPGYAGQQLMAGDTLTLTVSGGAAEVDAGAALIYYQDLSGIAARLHTWGDIQGSIEHVKFLEVDFNTHATAFNWQDTVITATEDLLAADRQYAVLGYTTDVNILALGVKGQDTGNMRICGVGTTETDDTGDYFIQLSQLTGMPCIPVFAANNKGSTFVCATAVQAATAIRANLVLARLAPSFSG